MMGRATPLAMALVLLGACGSEEQTQQSPAPEPAPVATPPPPDPLLLPAVPPATDGPEGADGFDIAYDASGAQPTITVRNQGTATFQGEVIFHLVWVGPAEGAEANPWRAVGALAGCGTPASPPSPIHTWRGAMTPGWTTSWDVARDRASFCRGDQLDGMDPPAGRYRASATFRRADGTVERVLWTQAFVRPAD